MARDLNKSSKGGSVFNRMSTGGTGGGNGTDGESERLPTEQSERDPSAKPFKLSLGLGGFGSASAKGEDGGDNAKPTILRPAFNILESIKEITLEEKVEEYI